MQQPRSNSLTLVLTLITLVLCVSAGCADQLGNQLAWPQVKAEHKPWAYWHWMGSAVNKDQITQHLEAYKAAGFGGMHIIPIYGVKGEEEQFIEYLSDKWMDMLAHTTAEAERLGMGIDMSTGTGWPPGGPNVSVDDATARVELRRYELSSGERLTEPVRLRDKKADRDVMPQALMGFSDDGRVVKLTERVGPQGQLNWTPAQGKWMLYAVFQVLGGKKVERAAPGAVGYIIDPFSTEVMQSYLTRFDEAFARYEGILPRAQYHDSYEYDTATWTDDFFEQFEKRRGYDLRRHLPALMGAGDEETAARVKCDYRETLSELHLDYIRSWVAWSHDKGFLTRNQAHGSPTNLLDTYAAADIPETEIFGPSGFEIPGLRIDQDFDFHGELGNPLALKFSSSAAHVAGHNLVASETCTWLGEHFKVALSQAKPEIDQLFVSGINHAIYHGTTYSPFDYPWPGWLFYASVHFCPVNSIWRDLPQLNAYVARCQSILQSGTPANDVLLYWPVYDVWHNKEGLMTYLGVHNLDRWLIGSGFHEAAKSLWERGYSFDYISDRLLEQAKVCSGQVEAGGTEYRVVVVPKCRFMPVKTLRRLKSLATEGATIVFHERLPEDVPGLGSLQSRRKQFRNLGSTVTSRQGRHGGIREATIGKGRFVMADDLEKAMLFAGTLREPIADKGISFIRRTHNEGYHYFLTNLGKEPLDEWVPLGVSARSVAIFEPLTGNRGLASVRQVNGKTKIYLQLEPGQSCVLRTFDSKVVDGPKWQYLRSAGKAHEIEGTWKVSFIEGGPKLPGSFETDALASWTELGDEQAKRFAGTAKYSIKLDKPSVQADEWILDLGQVCESARVRLNGKHVGTLWSIPFKIRIGCSLHEGENELELEVTNLSANRIRELDRRGVNWKKFYDINFVSIKYGKFNASDWALVDSGLLGPVRLVPHRYVEP